MVLYSFTVCKHPLSGINYSCMSCCCWGWVTWTPGQALGANLSLIGCRQSSSTY